MKKINLLLFVLTTLLVFASCSKDDDDDKPVVVNNSIVGKWKLSEKKAELSATASDGDKKAIEDHILEAVDDNLFVDLKSDNTYESGVNGVSNEKGTYTYSDSDGVLTVSNDSEKKSFKYNAKVEDGILYLEMDLTKSYNELDILIDAGVKRPFETTVTKATRKLIYKRY